MRTNFIMTGYAGGITCCVLLVSEFFFASGLQASDHPQWGQAWSRNMVSSEVGLPDSFDPASGRNILWSAELGTETHSSPVVAGGRIYIGTNNGHPRDPKEEGDRGVFMCFDEKSGNFLWQLAFPKRSEDIYFDWPNSGVSSPATVEGDRVYWVNNRGVVLCLDISGPSNRPPRTLWQFDLTGGAGIWSHDAAHSSILIHGNHLYLNSGTGVDNTHKRIRTPEAPSLVVLDKRTGQYLARDNEHIAPNIFHSTWCAPSLAEIQGRPLVVFGAGNGVLYAFDTVPDKVSGRSEAASGPGSSEPCFLKKVWQFDFDPGAPKENVHRFNSNRRESPSNFYGMPVVVQDRIFLAGGGDIWWGKNEAWLKCIDAKLTGDITTNGLVWSYPLQKHVLATPAVLGGLAFIADCGHRFHCVDATTGKPCWTHEITGEVWSSPLVADGKVYLGTRSGNFYVFAAQREKKVLAELALGSPMSSTPVAANAVLYVATMKRLFAVKAGN